MVCGINGSVDLLHWDDPALGVGQAAPLHTGHGVVQLLGDGADLAVADVGVLALPDQFLDGGDDGGGAGAKDFLQLAFPGGGHDVGDGQLALDDLVAPVLQQLDAAAAGDAGQHGAHGGGGVDLAVDLEHDVHAAHFFDVLLLDAVQPQHLGVALLLSQLAGLDGSGVVAAALGKAGQAGGGADVVVLHVDADGVDALGVVGAGGGADDAEDIFLGGVDAQAHVAGKDKGTDVQGRAVRVGDPVAVHVHDGLDGLDVVVLRDGGDAQTVGGVLHTLGVAVGPEQLDGAVGGAVSLHALKNFLGIVQHRGGGVELEGAVGHDAGVVPALTGGVVHDEHMVGEDLAETELRLVHRLGLGRGGAGDFDVQHDIPSLYRFTWRKRWKAPAPRFARTLLSIIIIYENFTRGAADIFILGCCKLRGIVL